MPTRAATEYRYEKLTWPEINDAVELGKVCILPCGAVEQHGPHLPLDVDVICPTEIAQGPAGSIPEKMLLLAHALLRLHRPRDGFSRAPSTPTSSISWTACSTSPRAWLTTGSRRSSCSTATARTGPISTWWPGGPTSRPTPNACRSAGGAFCPSTRNSCRSWRQSKFPGGCSHACELETSLYLYLDEDDVRKDQIKSGTISFNEEDSPFQWVDLFAAGPATIISWTSSYSETGVLGDAELATVEKGREAYEESVKQLVRFVSWFKDRPKDVRRDRHRTPPTMPIPWGQRPIGLARAQCPKICRTAGCLRVWLCDSLGYCCDLGTRAQPVRAGADHEVIANALCIQERGRLPHQSTCLRFVGKQPCLHDGVLLVGLRKVERS